MSSRERRHGMFEINDFVFYGMTGICRIDAICENPFEGAPAGVLYYVLNTLTEPKQTIFNPVVNEKVRIRPVMTECDAIMEDQRHHHVIMIIIMTIITTTITTIIIVREDARGAVLDQ